MKDACGMFRLVRKKHSMYRLVRRMHVGLMGCPGVSPMCLHRHKLQTLTISATCRASIFRKIID